MAVEPDPTARNQTLWLGLGGVVVALALALAALLRRDRAATGQPAAAHLPACADERRDAPLDVLVAVGR